LRPSRDFVRTYVRIYIYIVIVRGKTAAAEECPPRERERGRRARANAKPTGGRLRLIACTRRVQTSRAISVDGYGELVRGRGFPGYGLAYSRISAARHESDDDHAEKRDAMSFVERDAPFRELV